ncbi:hypothetical protein V6N12_058382 [Hibiscus sabdariffa]|uniref:Uncharacterized protein n=1 Tax=Hibiscus sabdariffa TaxID=183260 RepID=A0ABR2ESG1_9ROSI
MAVAGLDGFEIMWVAGSMILLAFLDVNSRHRLLSQDVLSTWFGCPEDWSLSAEYLQVDAAMEEPTSFEWAHILIETFVRRQIDERDVVGGAALSKQSQEVSVASPRKNSPVEQDGDDSPCWHANQLWGIESAGKGRGASMVVAGASDRVVCDCGGFCSEGDVDFALMGIRSREGLDIVQPSVSVAEWALLATVAPVIWFAHGGARKVKSVNTLVEALGSPVEKRVIVVARSMRGRGRPAKSEAEATLIIES